MHMNGSLRFAPPLPALARFGALAVALGFTASAEPVITRGPYLQLATPKSVIIKWRTSEPTGSRVIYGKAPDRLNRSAEKPAATTEHQVKLTDLVANRQYFYGIGTTTATLAAGEHFTFITAPRFSVSDSIRIWVLGDSGTGGAGAVAVRDAYAAFTGAQYTDAILMLGDNAYDNGTDAEFQRGLFDIYPGFLRQSPLWPALGNHDTAGSTDPSLELPYFKIFKLPTAGHGRGKPSRTEKYYSFDLANIHFVCLDSQSSSRSPGAPMLTWLRKDLARTTQDWIVAYWHHPPYSKGANDSDAVRQSIETRERINPVLEAAGVDLVLAGHSHNYERSFLIDGHYGASSTFDPGMKLDPGDGRETGNGAYRKSAGRVPNGGAVYVVCGSSAQLGSWSGGSTASINPNPHPAMFASLRELGSMVIDVNGPRMDVKFLRETGVIDDQFTIVKTPGTPGPRAR